MKNYNFHTVGHFSTQTAFSPSKVTEEFAFHKRITQTKKILLPSVRNKFLQKQLFPI